MRESDLKSFGSSFRAVVIGASGGIGRALTSELQQNSCCTQVVSLSRSADGFDILDESSVGDFAQKLANQTFDLILCATGALTIDGVGPEKTIRQISPEYMARQFAVNAIGPALVLKHFSPLLQTSRRSVFAVLSARVGSIGDNRLGGWMSYRSSKAALNQIVRTAAIEVARKNPMASVVAVHPGTVATSLSEPYYGKAPRTEPHIAARNILATLDSMSPSDTGGFFAYDGTRIEF